MPHNNYEKQDKQAGMGAQIGSASIVMIFAVLCLTIFAVLSFQTATHEQRLAQKTADAARAYYRADSIAEETYGRICNLIFEAENQAENQERMIAELDAMQIQQIRTQDGTYLRYCVPIDDVQALEVQLWWTARELSVVTWRAIAATEWEYDESLQVWDGTIIEVE
ncbi:MAG: hypothetical protein II301_02065 [Peptococcaceae bacterium]|nr:hypothetical protein [Peptococcaceae bacterium]MBQ2368891.1 hypothetical protein [Peptococcaceae bacterium]MBQ5615963.1 hypothetical protein [Peptococcaceae bacterium]MBQ5667891.1 hypothetical protein [Peptococcaceae bacterium]